MYGDNSTDYQSPSLALSIGGVYLSVAAMLLLIITVLAIDHLFVWPLRNQQPIDATPPAGAEVTRPEPAEQAALYGKLAELAEELSATAAERNRLATQLEGLLALRAELGLEADGSNGAATTDIRIALLRHIEQVERELAAVSQALGAAERRIAASQIEIAGLGVRLNRALLVKVEELQRGRSEFLVRLRDILGDRPGFRIEGDRFTMTSEVLFQPGADRLSPQGIDEVRRLAATINAVRSELPSDINWVLRVGGHTDKRPIANARFPSNWELSAMRAVTVVKALIATGVPPEHLAAAGFGEFQPAAGDDSEVALARNRRIEFRIDQP